MIKVNASRGSAALRPRRCRAMAPRLLLCPLLLAAAPCGAVNLASLWSALTKGGGGERAAAAASTAPASASAPAYPSELRDMPGHTRPEVVRTALPSSYVAQSELPEAFAWDDVNGANFLTPQLNQHVPQ